MLHRHVCVRQDDQSDCGAAALATVALHHGRPIAVQRLRELTGTDRIGTNLLGLVQAAERLGFSAKAVKGPYEALPTVPLPAIAHVRTDEGLGHFVVLHRVRKDRVVVADPGRGVRTLARDEFRRSWTGYLLVVVPEQGAAAPPGVGPPARPWRRFLGFLGDHKPVLAEAFSCALLMTVLGVSTSFFIQHLVDHVLVRSEGRLLNALGVGMVLTIVFRTLFGLLRQYLMAHIGRKVDLALIAGYARHVLRLPLSFFELRRVGEILSRVNDAAKVREAVSGTTLTTVVDGTLVVSLLAVLWLYDAWLALVASAFIPALLLGVAAHHPATRRRSRDAMEHAAGLSAHLVEDVSGVETVKAFGVERARAEEGEGRLVKLVGSCFSLQLLGLSMNTMGTSLTALAGVVVLWYGGHRVIDGALTVGELMFFYSLLGNLLGPLERLASVNLKLQDALVAVDRLYQVLDLEAEPVGAPGRVRFEGVRRAIELRGVTFRYGCRAPVLEGVDLAIPAGKTVAVVGESGSGKSTLLKLLMGFHAPGEGRLLIDGLDLRDYELGSLRAGIGLVAQSPFVFNGTIAENIALGRPGATLGEIVAAARAAGLEEFIAGLPGRYDTVVGEHGANLSGGQRQRLAIARALLRGPEVLLFDEATSHLDSETERAIQEGLRTTLAGKTVILVAHRLSTVREADLIYVLHGGRVVEAGTHQQLLACEGRYWSLWRAQTDEARRGHPRPHAANGYGKGVVLAEVTRHA
jgi:ATP-binding cassette subfamily B protein